MGKKKKNKVVYMDATQVGVSVNSNYYIEKLGHLTSLVEAQGDVPEAYIEPIRHTLKKLQTSFNNLLMFLPKSANKE